MKRFASGATDHRSGDLLLLVLCVAAVVFGVTAQAKQRDLKAEEILARAEKVRNPDLDFAVDFRLHVVHPDSSWKERDASYSMIAHGKDYSLVLMREPEQFHPGALLINHGLYWLILPKAQRPFQLAPRHVLNGDISNGDLARSNLLATYDPRLTGEEEVAGKQCYVLDLTRKRNRAMYPRVRYLLEKRTYRPLVFEYYGETGALIKVARYEDYRKGPLGWRAMRIEVENFARPGEKTTMTFSNLRKLDSAGLDFTREGLLAFRDAALALAQRQTGPVELEQLVDYLRTDKK